MALRLWSRGSAPPPIEPPRTAFVLGGGGNLGAIQVGMLRALLSRGITPDVVLGCSVGAINGAALAADPTTGGIRTLETVWKGLAGTSICATGRRSTLGMIRRGMALNTNLGLRHALEERLPIERFEEAELPLHVVATSLRTGLARWFTSGPIIDPLLASAALPGVLPPVEIDGELYVDGGVVDNVPVSRTYSLGVQRVVVLHVGNFQRDRPAPRRPIEVLAQSFSIARNSRFAHDVLSVPPSIELIVVPGVDPGRIRYNDFSRSSELIERGYASTAMFLDEGGPDSQSIWAASPQSRSMS